MKRQNEKYERELRDPALAALLKAAFTEDAALADAPGRTERIMRQVLASGCHPARRPSTWAPLGGVVAAAAAAVLVMILSITLVRLPAGWEPQMQHTIARLGPTQPATPVTPAAPQPEETEIAVAPPVVTVPAAPVAPPLWQTLSSAPTQRPTPTAQSGKVTMLAEQPTVQAGQQGRRAL